VGCRAAGLHRDGVAVVLIMRQNGGEDVDVDVRLAFVYPSSASLLADRLLLLLPLEEAAPPKGQTPNRRICFRHNVHLHLIDGRV